MTIELEQEFFKTFGIEPKYKTCIFKYCKNKKEYDCDNCGDRLWHYPEITAKKLLEMVCLVADIHNFNKEIFDIEQTNINDLKEFILCFLINYIKTEHEGIFYQNDEVKANIEQLFKD